MTNPPASVDISGARNFLRALDVSGAFTFQTFDDDDKRKSPSLARVFHGTLDENAGALSALNEQGAGVFVMVNEGDGIPHEGKKSCRTEDNVIRTRALFVDLDGAPLEPVLQCGIPPHIIVNSSPGRYHAYWRISDCSLADFKPLQQRLAAKFGSDPSVSDLPRVMRLPGFYHRKGAPALTTARSINARAPYTVAELIQGLALTSTTQSANADAMGGIHVAADPEEPCPEGQRNNRLTSLAGRWINTGKTYDELLAAASDWNRRKCSPPLGDTEVESVCKSIWQRKAMSPRVLNGEVEAAPN